MSGITYVISILVTSLTDITEIIFSYYRGIVLLQSQVRLASDQVSNIKALFSTNPIYLNSQNVDRHIDFFTTSGIGLFLAVVILPSIPKHDPNLWGQFVLNYRLMLLFFFILCWKILQNDVFEVIKVQKPSRSQIYLTNSIFVCIYRYDEKCDICLFITLPSYLKR